jgi:L-ribulose-5-phosphate 4-epimerase
VDLDGNIIEGSLKPSSDTPTHLELYRRFESIGGMTHTHSTHAVMFAQAQREIPCFGTTHADQFYGAVPLTRPLSQTEVEGDYELETGRVIVERFAGLNPLEFPGALVASHGPFTWGATVGAAVENAVALEAIAQIALGTLKINPQTGPVDQYLLDKHYLRKHGPGAYYGQKR